MPERIITLSAGDVSFLSVSVLDTHTLIGIADEEGAATLVVAQLTDTERVALAKALTEHLSALRVSARREMRGVRRSRWR